MSELVSDCPRCGAKEITFDLREATATGVAYGWQPQWEAFCVCRKCRRPTILFLAPSFEAKEMNRDTLVALKDAVNRFMKVEGFLELSVNVAVSPPEYLPADIEAAFKEGALCLAVRCYNAAGTMFRLCLDLATRPLLPEADTSNLNAKTKRDLAPRLAWLFQNGKLPEALRDLSTCIREDGNDGAHAGTLTKADAEDLLDFTVALLERMITEPARLTKAKQRRMERRKLEVGPQKTTTNESGQSLPYVSPLPNRVRP